MHAMRSTSDSAYAISAKNTSLLTEAIELMADCLKNYDPYLKCDFSRFIIHDITGQALCLNFS